MNFPKIAVVLFSLFVSSLTLAQSGRYSYGSSRSSSDSDSSSGDYTFGVGYASNAAALYSDRPGITGIFAIGNDGAIQAFFAMYDSDPNTYGMGAIYKHNIGGSRTSGFHVGGGLGLGTFAEVAGQKKSYFHIIGNAGIHFAIKKQIIIHIDGGLIMKSNDQTGSTEKDSGMVIAGFSDLLGISLIYMF